MFFFIYGRFSMERILWLIIMIPIGALFTGLGIYAWKRKKPMWFYSGSTVKERDISDIPAYNRANGIMWICFSAVFWISAIMGLFQVAFAGIFTAVGIFAGIPILAFIYSRIYAKYKR